MNDWPRRRLSVTVSSDVADYAEDAARELGIPVSRFVEKAIDAYFRAERLERTRRAIEDERVAALRSAQS